MYIVICKHLSTYRQEDAHEFLRYLIESMERCYLSVLGHAAKSYVSRSKIILYKILMLKEKLN